MAFQQKWTTETVKDRIKEIYGDSVLTDKVVYQSYLKPITLTCPKHGDYAVIAKSALNGNGRCPKCLRNWLTMDEFIKRVKSVYGEAIDNYSFDKVELKGNKDKIVITCKRHGDFKATPYVFLNGHGCKKCGYERGADKRRVTTDEFIKRALSIHHDKNRNPIYDYSRVKLDGNLHDKVIIGCKKHGWFEQRAYQHLQGNGCFKCNGSPKKTLDELKREIINIHGDRYNLDKISYVNAKTKVEIVCKEHGPFWITPIDLRRGRGCPLCNESHLERECEAILRRLDIGYVRFHKDGFLGLQSLDFYLPDYRIGIECQGEQHYDKRSFYFTPTVLELDSKKNELCSLHGINILYVFKNGTCLEFIMNNTELNGLYTPSNSIMINRLENFLKGLAHDI